MSLLDLVAAGAVGGLAADLGARLLHRWIVKPRLDFKRDGTRNFIPTSGTGRGMAHRIVIENNGKTAAKNCKAEFRIEGRRSTGPNSEIRYVAEGTSFWAEEDDPTRITINRGESAQVAVYRYDMTRSQGVFNPRILFPAENGWPEKEDQIEEYSYKNDELEDLSFSDKILLPHFNNIDWIDRSIKVTAENAEGIEGKWEIVQEIDNKGMEGNRIKVEPLNPCNPHHSD